MRHLHDASPSSQEAGDGEHPIYLHTHKAIAELLFAMGHANHVPARHDAARMAGFGAYLASRGVLGAEGVVDALVDGVGVAVDAAASVSTRTATPCLAGDR